MNTNHKLTPDALLTIPEAQAALKVSRGFIYILRDRGALDFVKLGRAARIRQSSIDRLVQDGAIDEEEVRKEKVRAAAPLLLDALRDCVALIERDMPGDRAAQPELIAARAAIAAATN